MNREIDESTSSNNEAFDHEMRQLHAAATINLSPATLARLRAARHQTQAAPQRGQAWRWAVASAFSAVLAVAIGTQLLPHSTPAPATRPLAAATTTSNDGDVDSLATLDENPDLYLWLASSEADPLAME